MKAKRPGAELPELLLSQLTLLCVAGYYYGPRAWILGGIAALTCLVLDYFCITLRRLPFRAANLDSITTGLTLALLMPASVPYDILIISCFAAIIIGKQLFGGRQNLLFPPAAVGFLFAALSWKDELLQYPAPFTRLPLTPTVQTTLGAPASDAFLANIFSFSTVTKNSDFLLGLVRGPMGATPIALLLVCGAVLLLRRCISVPVTLGAAGIVTGMLLLGNRLQPALLCNMTLHTMLLFALIFLIGDTRLAPKGTNGVIFGMLAAGFGLYLTLALQISYGFVIVSVLLSPLGVWMRRTEQRISGRLPMPPQQAADQEQGA